MQVIEELEKIDDDCDKHGIQFVKIDDRSAAKEYGIKSVRQIKWSLSCTIINLHFILKMPTIVFYEKQEPNRYEGDLMDEDDILHWLLGHLEKDEIEDVTEEMLDKLVKEGRTMAVLFCKNFNLN